MFNPSVTALGVGGITVWIFAIIASYFIGNISPATLVAKAAGIDIRKEGSGNPGTTNVLRVLGKKAAAGTLVIDILKGVAAVLLGGFLGNDWLGVLCGFAAFIGHLWPVVFHFKGGKGIATAFGILLAVDLLVAVICLGCALLGMLMSRRVSIGSISGAVSLPVMIGIFESEYLPVFTVMAILVIFRHRSNIQRIIRGEESKLNFKK